MTRRLKPRAIVYVDDLVEWGAAGQYRGNDATQAERVGAKNGHKWCHMFSTDLDELHRIARRIGLKREWFQGDHYDLTPGRRAKAIALGVVEADRQTTVSVFKRLRHRREQ